MAGRFDGLKEEEWNMIAPLIPEEPYIFGRPHSDRRKIVNTILYVLITGCRWCDVPRGPQWGKRSTAHEYLGIWQASESIAKAQTSFAGDGRTCIFDRLVKRLGRRVFFPLAREEEMTWHMDLKARG